MTVSLLIAASIAQIPASPSPSIDGCGFTANRIVLKPSELPPAISRLLSSTVPELAERDEVFQQGDLVRREGLAGRRFVSAISYGRRWVVLYEHGVPDHVHAVVFAPTERRGQYAFVPNGNLVGPICAVGAAALGGVVGSGTNHF